MRALPKLTARIRIPVDPVHGSKPARPIASRTSRQTSNDTIQIDVNRQRFLTLSTVIIDVRPSNYATMLLVERLQSVSLQLDAIALPDGRVAEAPGGAWQEARQQSR
jgi:hypothetical protein